MTQLKEQLGKRDPLAGMHVSLADSCITELCGYVDYDFIWIDTEHTAIDYHILLEHIIAAKAAGVSSLVRIPWNDAILAKRVLEMGPTGLIFPVVNSAEELDKAMKSTLYPPNGNRGFGPMRAVRYGLDDADEYIRKGSLDMVRCVQIESKLAVDNLEEMAKNPWVDCFIFGPCDLSGSIGELNRVFDPNTSDLIDRAVAILKKAGKSVGVSTGSDDPEVLRYWHDKGINVISAGTDYLHIMSGARKVRGILREIQGHRL
ncbi:MAG TPA: aldolase/citrate lyase family protein [Rectinemataceae bacterium]|nr:aldolase/citrate lyase family protein [Rectinemataceae bacterium]